MDEAKDGVIIFSFGSVINASRVLEGDKLTAFSRAFSRLQQKVLWKWETDMVDKPDNVIISKWLPQQEILGSFYFDKYHNIKNGRVYI
jgi:glucuronosyltransferase